MRALTASFRVPFAYTGVQLSLPMPSYCNILGLISCIAGRNILPNETKIGFEFSAEGRCWDLERFIRWSYESGKAKINPKGPAVRKREFLINPQLTLYITNRKLKDAFLNPIGIPTFGRSQDMAVIEKIDEISVSPVKEGKIGGTFIPLSIFQSIPQQGILIRIPEYATYDLTTRVRKMNNSRIFVATNTLPNHYTKVTLPYGLYNLPDPKFQDHCIYIHEWIEQ